MVIKKLMIHNFGKIHDREIILSPGINVLYGENESGKTTVHTFMKAMLYGVQRMRGKAAHHDMYTRYEPWENPSVYGGSMWFETGGRNYRLSRNFHRSSVKNEFLCEESGELLNVEKGDLETVLNGVSEAVYDNTVSIAQLKSVTGPELVKELQNYMASYQGTGDNSVDLGRAAQMLKMTRKGFLVQEEHRKKDIEKACEKLTSGMDYLRQDMEKLMERKEGVISQEEQLKMSPGEEDGGSILDGRIRVLEKKKNFLLGAMAVTLLAAIALIAGLSEWIPETGWAKGAAGVAGIFLVMMEFFAFQKKRREVYRKKRMKERWLQKQEKLKWNRENISSELTERKTAYMNLQEEYKECSESLYYPSNEETEIKALNLAMETIEMLSGNIYKRVGGRLKERTSQILSEITGGKYQEVLMDSEFRIKVNMDDRAVALERLSRGTIEQIYFALRMAAGELLCKEERFPVVLDDVFGMYDEERLSAVLRWIYKENRQVIISTCHKREMEILEKENIPYNKILL